MKTYQKIIALYLPAISVGTNLYISGNGVSFKVFMMTILITPMPAILFFILDKHTQEYQNNLKLFSYFIILFLLNYFTYKVYNSH